MSAMSLIFAAIYLMTISRVGYRYNDAILVPAEENGNTIYSGKIKGVQAQFVVTNENVVVFHYGDRTYGPYSVTEDDTAIPKDDEKSGSMTGIEVREGNDILFRGGVIDWGDVCSFYNEDGSSDNVIIFSYMTADGIERDHNGDPIDRMKPSTSTIYELIRGPELTHKGDWSGWFGAVFICVLNALSILFADELFRWDLAFRIRNAEHAQPSEWEIAGRYVGWTAVSIAALMVFLMGLQQT